VKVMYVPYRIRIRYTYVYVYARVCKIDRIEVSETKLELIME